VDIPKFPYSVEELDTHTKSEFHAFWSYDIFTTRSGNDPLCRYEVADIKPDIKEKFPALVEWINLFPFKSIRNIQINTQHSINGAQPHIDFDPRDKLGRYTEYWKNHDSVKSKFNKTMNRLYVNNRLNEPCGYRTILSGIKDDHQYYIYNNQKIHTHMPVDTDTFCLNSTELVHGAEKSEVLGTRKILYMHFEIDKKDHQKILQASLKKYGDLAVYGDRQGMNEYNAFC
jgi:hypothetical protein